MTSNLLVKVCGMREAENIRQVEALGIDYMGFIFYPKSPRYVAERPEYLPVSCKRIGVFVNAEEDFIEQKISEFCLDGIQLHGSESAKQCRRLKDAFDGLVIKAVSIADEADVVKARIYTDACDALLFDTPCTGYGGSGKGFDLNLLTDADFSACPFFLSGGIGLDSLGALNRFHHPNWTGIDINSRFELSPGLKSPELISRFLKGID